MKNILDYSHLFLTFPSGTKVKATVANSFFKRTRGLLFMKQEEMPSGLLIPYCQSIHTCFMSEELHVIFLDKNFSVARTYPFLGPWKFTLPRSYYSHVLEIPVTTNPFNILPMRGEKASISCIS